MLVGNHKEKAPTPVRIRFRPTINWRMLMNHPQDHDYPFTTGCTLTHLAGATAFSKGLKLSAMPEDLSDVEQAWWRRGYQIGENLEGVKD